MKNQFFYSRVGGEKEYIDSFNINKVIRTVATDEGLIVVLDDLHERAENIPDVDARGKMKGVKRVRNTFQSEITLNLVDAKRFTSLLEI